MKLKKKSLILIAFLMLIFLSVGYATLQTSIGISGLVNIKGSKVLTFDANGGSVSTSNKRVVPNGEYGELPTPEKEEYEFLGWYTSETGGEKVTSESIVTNNSNHTLYAHWIRSTLLFSGNGPDNYTTTQGILENGDYSTELYINFESGGYFLTIRNYVGAGNSRSSFINLNGKETTLNDAGNGGTGGDLIDEVTYMVTEPGKIKLGGCSEISVIINEKNIPVNFKFNGYRITYNANGGSNNAPIYSVTTIINKGDIVSIAHDQLYRRDGYKLLGYSTNKNATTAMYSPNQKITPTDNMTLYAIWDNHAVLTYDLNGGSIANNSHKEQTFEMGKSITLEQENMIYRNDYLLLGFDTNKYAEEPTYYVGQQVSFNNDIKLYAIWGKTMHFHPYGTTKYSFDGTYSINNDTGGADKIYIYLDGSSYSIGYTLVSSATSPSVKFITTGGKILLNVSYDGSYKTGNSTINGPGTLIFEGGGSISIRNSSDNSPVTLKCDTDNYNTITYETNGGSWPVPALGKETYKKGENVSIINLGSYWPNKSGYTLLGYSTDNSSNVAYKPGDYLTLTNNMTLYAVWQKN